MELKVMFPDMERRMFYPARVVVQDGKIKKVSADNSIGTEKQLSYILPGLVDAHIHIESSMLVPSQFSRIAVRHGTVATVSDPHEIANVLGVSGVRYMINNAQQVPLKINYTIPSCVPATPFEQSGADLDEQSINELAGEQLIVGLGEMMNFPGVIQRMPDVMKKIQAARNLGLPIDGHAPGLQGNELDRYLEGGITTDHEAYSYEEAKEKIEKGMKILIREGSAAKNFNELHPLIGAFSDQIMLCSDDLHPDDLIVGHINVLFKRALDLGYDIFDLIRIATINPVLHYGLNVGLLRVNDPADFILIDHPDQFNVLETWIDGEPVFSGGEVHFSYEEIHAPNTFIHDLIDESDLKTVVQSGQFRVIEAIDGSLISKSFIADMLADSDQDVGSDMSRDILKISVVNRYKKAQPALGLINGFGLKRGAIASSVAHDSHNIIALGCSNKDIAAVVNALILNKGGIALNDGNETYVLPLPVGGIMSNHSAESVAGQYAELTQRARQLGSRLVAPFMTLSFMALLVIPELKIGDRGLFDGSRFDFVSLRIDS